jgi:mannitol/fructose-specific phosphotransferase system IIA component (Ntr-type)
LIAAEGGGATRGCGIRESIAAMPGETLETILRSGTVRVGYHTVDFASAVRGLLVPPLLEHGVSPAKVDSIIDCVLQREASGTTCSGLIALPHGRVAGIPRIVAGLGINRDGIYSGGSARVMLAFVSPQDAAAEHLRFLSAAAKTFRDSARLDRILAAATPDQVLDILKDAG